MTETYPFCRLDNLRSAVSGRRVRRGPLYGGAMTEERDWDVSYRGEDPPPWDIGRPQPAFVALAEQGRLVGDVLEPGCGTGEHSLLAAAHGARVTGVDLAESAIRTARQKAAERGLDARFEVGDMLTMELPQDGFDIVIDCGVFHVFDDEDRGRYVAALSRVLRAGGSYLFMCFSDRQPGDWGPRRVTKAEIDEVFAADWTITAIEPAVLDINPFEGNTTAQAWLVDVRRTD
jgi:SAM-dependent methyltransferase